MYCSQCGKKLPDDAQFCGFCGASLLQEKSTCPMCGHEYSEEMLYCCYCGTKLADSLVEAPVQAPTQEQDIPIDQEPPQPPAPIAQAVSQTREMSGAAKVWQQGDPASGQAQGQQPVPIVPAVPPQPELPVDPAAPQSQDAPNTVRIWQQGQQINAQEPGLPQIAPSVQAFPPQPELPVYPAPPQAQEMSGAAKVWQQGDPASGQTQGQQPAPSVQAFPPQPEAAVYQAAPPPQGIPLQDGQSGAELKKLDNVSWILGEHKMAVINATGTLSLYPDRLELKKILGNNAWGVVLGIAGYAISKSKAKKAPPEVFAMNEIASVRESKYLGTPAIVLEMKNGAKHTLAGPFGAQSLREWVQIIQLYIR